MAATGLDGWSVAVIPWGTLTIIAVVGTLAGLLAGVQPARRAARLDVLEAIATERPRPRVLALATAICSRSAPPPGSLRPKRSV